MSAGLFGDVAIRTAFEAYHGANPQVYAKLREFALEAKRAGRSHFGIKMLIERVRWYTTVEAAGDPWKINNNFAPYYARLLMMLEPDLEGLFELRKANADVEGPPREES